MLFDSLTVSLHVRLAKIEKKLSAIRSFMKDCCVCTVAWNFSRQDLLDFINWYNNWQKRISINDISKEKSLELMKKSNPIIIPRNHKVEEALKAANEDDLEVMNRLLSNLNNPYNYKKGIEDYQLPSSDENYQTFCGT